MTIGKPLPQLHLSLAVDQAVPMDLEQTYNRAAAAAYLS